ncbi:hypothetical protein BBD39_05550 [Arsenophonus endosymbiont of Bemisia tabaci Asia II 3]|nr:hypothetical protein BBD39_05550 [Arsenophonus endosymbiont of Bemisia tabaci Asia II 3]
MGGARGVGLHGSSIRPDINASLIRHGDDGTATGGRHGSGCSKMKEVAFSWRPAGFEAELDSGVSHQTTYT